MVDLNEQIKCVQREIKMRRRVYPWRVSQGKMTRDAADREIAAMEAIEKTLTELLVDPDEFELT